MGDSVQSIISELAAVRAAKRLWKTAEFPMNTALKVLRFKKCNTRYGDAIIVELEQANYFLPTRYTKILTTEKLEKLNSPEFVVHIKLTGFERYSPSITSPVFEFTHAKVGDNETA